MQRRTFLRFMPAALAASQLPDRPKVPGTLTIRTRKGKDQQTARWDVAQTVIIICDMWDTHTCAQAAQRVSVMAPRMNQVVTAARSLGVAIIHAPSDTMKFYEGTPGRQRMQSAPKAPSATPVLASCPRPREESASFPIDDSDGGCDDPVVKPWKGPYPWTRQHPAIDIIGFDGISDNGQEIYNYLKHLGVTNVALMGVHTNMCILNRGFGIRQLTQLGFNVVLVRDLTDAMYNPRMRPFVSHTRGTELVIEHIEAKFCPSILSPDLTTAV